MNKKHIVDQEKFDRVMKDSDTHIKITAKVVDDKLVVDVIVKGDEDKNTKLVMMALINEKQLPDMIAHIPSKIRFLKRFQNTDIIDQDEKTALANCQELLLKEMKDNPSENIEFAIQEGVMEGGSNEVCDCGDPDCHKKAIGVYVEGSPFTIELLMEIGCMTNPQLDHIISGGVDGYILKEKDKLFNPVATALGRLDGLDDLLKKLKKLRKD